MIRTIIFIGFKNILNIVGIKQPKAEAIGFFTSIEFNSIDNC